MSVYYTKCISPRVSRTVSTKEELYKKYRKFVRKKGLNNDMTFRLTNLEGYLSRPPWHRHITQIRSVIVMDEFTTRRSRAARIPSEL